MSVRPPLLAAQLHAPGPEDLAEVGGELHLLYEPAAAEVQLLDVLAVTQRHRVGLHIVIVVIVGLPRHVRAAVRPDQLQSSEDTPLIKLPVLKMDKDDFATSQTQT